MDSTPSEIETVLKLLAATPRRLTAMSRDRAASSLQGKPSDEAWSPNEILGHLRVCADVWGKSMLAMIAQDHPTLRYVSPRSRLKKTNYLELDFDQSLQAYAQQRLELLKTLKALARQDWSRGATFTATTRGREQTVLSYAWRLADHELVHLEQIEAVLKEV
jgi:hypothetical protein